MRFLFYIYLIIFLIFWCSPDLTMPKIINAAPIYEQIAQADETSSPLEQKMNQEVSLPDEVPTTNADSQMPVVEAATPSPSDAPAAESLPPIEKIKPALNEPSSPPNEAEHAVVSPSATA